jgi:hypothetical protein
MGGRNSRSRLKNCSYNLNSKSYRYSPLTRVGGGHGYPRASAGRGQIFGPARVCGYPRRARAAVSRGYPRQNF